MSRPYVPSVDEVAAAVAAHRATTRPHEDGWAAATALVLADVDGDGAADVLFIRRTTRPGDRWSGQMALPGGKREPQDPDLAATAVRETAEEVGVDLPPAVGRLDDLTARVGRGRVATFVHVVRGRPPTVPERREVDAVVWIPLAHLLAPGSAVRHRHGAMGPFAGIRFRDDVVWGLTLGTLGNFCDVLGVTLPRPRGPLLG